VTTTTLRLVASDDAAPRTITGKEVMDAIGVLLAEHLPSVPFDDVFRPALDALALAGGVNPRTGGRF